jgi:hypothetical protein
VIQRCRPSLVRRKTSSVHKQKMAPSIIHRFRGDRTIWPAVRMLLTKTHCQAAKGRANGGTGKYHGLRGN